MGGDRWFKIELPAGGNLTLRADPLGSTAAAPPARLSLYDGQLQLLSSSQSLVDGSVELATHLPAGVYLVRVAAAGSVAGAVQLSALFEEAGSPLEPLDTDKTPFATRYADLNGDGIQDIVSVNNGAANVSVFLGLANGALSRGVNYAVGANAYASSIADVNGDGVVDLLVVNKTTAGTLSVLLGAVTGRLRHKGHFLSDAIPRPWESPT